MGIERVEIGNAIIAGMASGDTELEKMLEITSHLEKVGFVIVPRKLTYEMRAAAVNTTSPGIGEPPLYEKLWNAMIDAARQRS